jgi:hypothetical protein
MVLFPFPKRHYHETYILFLCKSAIHCSGRRVPELPAGPHKLLAILAEPLNQKENLISLEDPEVSDNLLEFEDWVWSLLLIPMCIFSLCK